MKLTLALLLFTAMLGCTSTSLTEVELAEVEWRRGIDLENWNLCSRAYRQNNAYTVHLDHAHGPRDRVTPHMIRSDLMVNNCRQILGKYWAKY